MHTRALFLSIALCVFAAVSFADTPRITVNIDAAPAATKKISTELIGIFFEDISYAADGGLYAELIQNRSFEYSATEQPAWNNLTCWEFTARGDGAGGKIFIDNGQPVHPNNPHCLILFADKPGDGVGVTNTGFDGIPVRAGETYNLAFFARQLFVGGRWDQVKKSGALPVVARLESKDGEILAESAPLEITSRDWTRHTAALTATKTDPAARFVLLAQKSGGIALDEISLFPQNTFRNRPNGLRADLAEAIAALKPRFMRFPGGCLVHGGNLGNIYRWQDTIGPIEQRRQQPNIWRYHQTAGLGYFEYFQFCEDIGAKPLPVVPAGVCCQNANYEGGTGQRALPLDEMPAYIQEVLDLIEYANGPVTSAWGAKRAAAGHPAPFNLEYLGVGNEEHITPEFRERFAMIYAAVKKAHPEITVIGTSGPFWKGEDYDNGWKIANELRVPMMDEHYYETPAWFWQNLRRYDAYDHAKSKVYVGEYAAHDTRRRLTLRSALAEAAHLTALERNGDIVAMSSYAPLLARIGNTSWNPNLIYFTNTEVFPTLSYHVQKLFGNNAGDVYLDTTDDTGEPAPGEAADFAASTVRDSATGDIIIKFVSNAPTARTVAINLRNLDLSKYAVTAARTVLASDDPDILNDRAHPDALLPKTTTLAVGRTITCEAPANSLTIVRLSAR